MVVVGDDAPEFTASLADGDVSQFTLSENVGDSPLVLAFFPAAFTGTCTSEMVAFENDLDAFEDLGASVYGASVDLPFALNEFRDQHDLSFGLVSDAEGEIIDAHDVETTFPDLGIDAVAKRAVFVVDSGGCVTYRWVGDDLGVEPPYEEVATAVADAA
jgi:peroxiredoxin